MKIFLIFHISYAICHNPHCTENLWQIVMECDIINAFSALREESYLK